MMFVLFADKFGHVLYWDLLGSNDMHIAQQKDTQITTLQFRKTSGECLSFFYLAKTFIVFEILLINENLIKTSVDVLESKPAGDYQRDPAWKRIFVPLYDGTYRIGVKISHPVYSDGFDFFLIDDFWIGPCEQIGTLILLFYIKPVLNTKNRYAITMFVKTKHIFESFIRENSD